MTTDKPTDAMIKAGANALRGFIVKDDEGYGWSLDKAEREKAASLVIEASSPQSTAPSPDTDLVERVARAIYEASRPFVLAGNNDVLAWSESQREIWNTVATAAIEALTTTAPPSDSDDLEPSCNCPHDATEHHPLCIYAGDHMGPTCRDSDAKGGEA